MGIARLKTIWGLRFLFGVCFLLFSEANASEFDYLLNRSGDYNVLTKLLYKPNGLRPSASYDSFVDPYYTGIEYRLVFPDLMYKERLAGVSWFKTIMTDQGHTPWNIPSGQFGSDCPVFPYRWEAYYDDFGRVFLIDYDSVGATLHSLYCPLLPGRSAFEAVRTVDINHPTFTMTNYRMKDTGKPVKLSLGMVTIADTSSGRKNELITDSLKKWTLNKDLGCEADKVPAFLALNLVEKSTPITVAKTVSYGQLGTTFVINNYNEFPGFGKDWLAYVVSEVACTESFSAHLPFDSRGYIDFVKSRYTDATKGDVYVALRENVEICSSWFTHGSGFGGTSCWNVPLFSVRVVEPRLLGRPLKHSPQTLEMFCRMIGSVLEFTPRSATKKPHVLASKGRFTAMGERWESIGDNVLSTLGMAYDALNFSKYMPIGDRNIEFPSYISNQEPGEVMEEVTCNFAKNGGGHH